MFKAGNNGESAHELIQRKTGGFAVNDLAPRACWSEMSESDHFVQFYETDAFLLNSLSEFIGTGLSAGEAGIVVARKAQRDGLEERLRPHDRPLVGEGAIAFIRAGCNCCERVRPVHLFGRSRDAIEVHDRWTA